MRDVSANYRVGALGALDLSSLSDPGHRIDGNLFLRDLVLALRWVRDNIHSFGGDAQRVTIFGPSAGAHCVETLMATPAAAGLFARAICQSSANGLHVPAHDAAVHARRFAEILGATPTNAAPTILQARPATLVDALYRLMAEHRQKLTEKDAGVGPGRSAVLGPCIDGEYLPSHPIDAMQQGMAHKVPLIVGYNAGEARLFTRMFKWMPYSQDDLERLLAAGGHDRRDRILANYRDYPDRDARLRLAGDMFFSTAAWQMAEAHHRHARVYFYRYDYAPRGLQLAGLKAAHGTELLAEFDCYRGILGAVLAGRARAEAMRVGDDMQQRWLAFAHDGIPGTDWPVYAPPERAMRIFDTAARIEHDPDATRRKAWNQWTFT